MTFEEIIQSAGKMLDYTPFYYENDEIVEIDPINFVNAKIYYNSSLIGTIMNCMEITLKVDIDKPIYLKVVATLGNNSATKTYGAYTIKDKSYNASDKTYNYKCYDEMINLMVEYKPLTIEFPCTIFDYFTELVSELNLTTEISSLPNGNKVMASDIYTGINYTYRDILQDIGEATATLFKVNGAEIQKATLGTTEITIDDNILLNNNIEVNEHYGAINTIVLARAGDGDKIYYPEVLPENPFEYKISDNQLMNGNDRDEYMEAIYNELNGIEFDLFDFALTGYGGFEPLQKINIETGDNTYSSYVFNNEIQFGDGYAETIYTESPDKTSSNYKVMDYTDKRVNQAFIQVNKQTQQITALTEQVEELDPQKIEEIKKIVDDLDLGNYALKTDLSNIIQRIQEVETTQSNTYLKTEIKEILKGTFIDSSGQVLPEIVKTLSATIDKDGLKIEKSESPTSSLIDDKGLHILDSNNEEILKAGYETYIDSGGNEQSRTIVRARDMQVSKYLEIEPVRFEKYTKDYEDSLGCFWLK